jgi:hypothetical protein
MLAHSLLALLAQCINAGGTNSMVPPDAGTLSKKGKQGMSQHLEQKSALQSNM